MTKGDISFYLDTLLIETVLGNPSFTKTAQAGALSSGLGDMVKEYFSAHWDPNNRVDSVLNMLAPTAISAIFRGLGFGKLGLIFGLIASTLHIDVAGMIHSIYNAISGKLEQGQPIAPSELDSAVSGAIQEHVGADQPFSIDSRNFDKELRDARLVRLALEQHELQMLQLTKEGQRRSPSWFTSPGARSTTGSFIGRIIGWVFKTILMSAGFMVAGDVAAKMLGRPSALDRTWHAGQQPSETASQPGKPAPTLWVEHVTNDPGSIENMLVGFAKDVYPNLAGKEDAIKKSPTFQAIKEHIAWYNHTSAGEPEVYIPSNYPDKKSLVDRFAGEVK